MARPMGPFSGKAKYPVCQPVVDALIGFCVEREIGAMQLAILLYGVRADGKTPCNTTTAYKLMHGSQGLTEYTAEVIKEKIGLDLFQYVVNDLGRHMAREQLPAVAKRKPVASQAVAAYEAQDREDGWKKLDPPRARQAPPRFALVVQQDGTASMTMNLLDVEADTALRAFDAMKLLGLVKGG